MLNFLIQILTNALALYLAARFVPNFEFAGDIVSLLLAGFIFGLINFFLKPLLKFLSAPIIILSLGLWTIFINIFLLWLLVSLIPELQVTGFWAYFWGTIIVAAVNIFVHTLAPRKSK